MDKSSIETYQNGREHLAHELLRLDALLHLKVLERKQRERASHGKTGDVTTANMDIFKGLYIPEEEIERITGSTDTPNETGDVKQKALIDHIKQLRETLSRKIDKSLKAGIHLPFYHLASVFHLNFFELDTLLICLAPLLDAKYEKFYSYLQDNVTKKFPAVNLILDILCSSGNPAERIDAQSFFLDQSPLFRYGLVKFIGGGDHQSEPLISRCLKLDDRIANFLLGFNVMDAELSSFARIINPTTGWASLVMEDELKEQLIRLSGDYLANVGKKSRENKHERAAAAEPTRLVFYLKGPYGVGKKSAAEAFCYHLQLPLLIVDIPALSRFTKNSVSQFEKTLKQLFRETLLQTAVVYIEGFDRVVSNDDGVGRDVYQEGFHQELIVRAVEEFSFITFLAGEKQWHPRGRFRNRRFIPLEFSVPPYSLRRRLWEQYLKLPGEIDIDGIAGKFHFTAGQIRDAAAEAGNVAAMRKSNKKGKNGITMEDLYRGCRSQSNRKLSEMALKIEPHYTWSDIVLPSDELLQLKEIRNCVKYRHVVYSDWGFDKKLSLGKGLNILFSGPSGTGKTMAAEVIANELRLDLYKIDLSCVVSKYIGETEKNLAGIFREAETANAVLFFDEADALFGKRSEVRDSHDRYANIEIGYLLQRMEEYEGVVILATNMKKNMDEAFVRRMHFTVDFPFPDKNSRLRIWQNIFPKETPLEQGIDYEFLSKSFNISGGNIKNIALAAAFYAADDGMAVTMVHMVQACKREFQKMGKLCLKSDFGHYYDLIHQDE
jgi:SpoVK/Ycf46/Vps4 family AAA+-type ATPase